MTTDPDGDSQMASSPESSHHTDDLPAGARTPTNLPRSHFAGAASELSPPGSQTQSISTLGLLGLGKTVAPDSTVEGAASTQSQSQPQMPSWMSKRAEEEYQRAMEYVVDQEFNLDEFGDPFDERDMEETIA